MAKLPVYINGRFLGKPTTGTQRFAREIVFALEEILAREAGSFTILAPRGTPRPEGLSRISFETCGPGQGHVWEQVALPYAARRGVLVNLTNSGPICHGRQITVIHDAMVYRTPENYSFLYRSFHRVLGWLLARRSRLATVSSFSRRELAACLGIGEAGIVIIPNGHEHILRQEADETVLDRLGLRDRPFFFFVGSPTPNKNLARAVEAFRGLGRDDIAFVIVGAAKADIFKDTAAGEDKAILRPGRLTDAEIVALYRHARALVFPSLYEGFGIPPLEAMVLGCPVLASDIPPVRDVCADCALTFDPQSVEKIRQALDVFLGMDRERQILIDKSLARAKQFSWRTSAQRLLDFIRSVGEQ